MIVYMKMDFRIAQLAEHDKHLARAGSWVRIPLLKIFLFIFEFYYIFNYIIIVIDKTIRSLTYWDNKCRDDGIGRHAALKMPWPVGRVGSSPILGTIKISEVQESFRNMAQSEEMLEMDIH